MTNATVLDARPMREGVEISLDDGVMRLGLVLDLYDARRLSGVLATVLDGTYPYCRVGGRSALVEIWRDRDDRYGTRLHGGPSPADRPMTATCRLDTATIHRFADRLTTAIDPTDTNTTTETEAIRTHPVRPYLLKALKELNER